VSPPGHHAQLRRAGIRELYQDWDDKAQASVGHLRILAAPYPHDASLLELIGRLLVQSPEFAGMWATNQIRSTTSAHYRMHHPLVGRFDVTSPRGDAPVRASPVGQAQARPGTDPRGPPR